MRNVSGIFLPVSTALLSSIAQAADVLCVATAELQVMEPIGLPAHVGSSGTAELRPARSSSDHFSVSPDVRSVASVGQP